MSIAIKAKTAEVPPIPTLTITPTYETYDLMPTMKPGTPINISKTKIKTFFLLRVL